MPYQMIFIKPWEDSGEFSIIKGGKGKLAKLTCSSAIGWPSRLQPVLQPKMWLLAELLPEPRLARVGELFRMRNQSHIFKIWGKQVILYQRIRSRVLES